MLGWRQMAPAMTGPQTTAAEIAKIAAMITHDHQSLSVDIDSGRRVCLRRRSLGDPLAIRWPVGKAPGGKG